MRVLNIEDQNISDAEMRSIQAKTMVIVGDADGVKPEHAVAMTPHWSGVAGSFVTFVPSTGRVCSVRLQPVGRIVVTLVAWGDWMETSDSALARTIEARVLASHARQIAAEIRSVAARHSQVAGELSELARNPRQVDNDDQVRLVAGRLQREFEETDARSQQLIATGDEIEARRRELLTKD
jgi:hypothetical protein